MRDSNKSVLITGGTGFIGNHVLAALVNAGWKATLLTRKKLKDCETYKVLFGDLSRPETLVYLLKAYRFDAIVHLGAKVDFTDDGKAELFSSNVLSTGILSYIAQQWGAHLLFTSTAIVCGRSKELIEPHSPLLPDTKYAESKWLGEQLVNDSNARSIIIRVGGVFGRSGPLHLRLNNSIEGALRGIVPSLLGSGVGRRNYIYVKDVAEAIVFSLERELNGVHFLANQEVLTIKDMLNEVCRIFIPGKSVKIFDGPETNNQIIVASDVFPRFRRFHEALTDIKDLSEK